MAAIELRNTTKRYPDGTAAVRDVSLRVEDSEIMILVGPSGCGKSTVLRMLAGLEDVTEGEIAIDGTVINELAPQERDIAMVFQNYALYPHMTVRRNMGFALKLQRVDSSTIDAKVEQAARILDLEPQLDRRPGQLSGGQRQRVAMGRAIVRDPKAFLMDEPLSNLDAKLRVQMRSEIARLQARLGTTTIYVTHDQTEAMTLGHRVAVMRQGVVQQVGPPRELFERPANLFVAGFIGSPAMNFLPGHADGGTLDTPLGRIPLTEAQRRALDDERPADLICGIRPGDFEDAALVAESRPGARAQIQVDVLEHLGNEAYVHFRTGATAVAEQLTELAEDADRAVADERHEVVVARVGAETRAVAGGTLDLWFDPARLHLFDARSGRALRAEPDERS